MNDLTSSSMIRFRQDDVDENFDIDEEEESLDMGPDMNLVNGPNPWLPAYGFQIQHHNSYNSTHEDLRTNDTVLVQQVDFLETILEETSDDLQSDSDRSGTTYWLGSDSETESVIHIKANQRAAEEKLDGSGSECNSVVPKKRRRRNGTDHHHHHHHHQQQHQQQLHHDRFEESTTFGEEFPTSPRSSRSSGSSRASSLLQFESLERTCATFSPSCYSFDSLEYANRSNASRLENNTSPDSLEDYERVVPNGFPGPPGDCLPRIRPYRSFESLDTCQKDRDVGQEIVSNGFAPLFSKRNSDLSRTRRSNGGRRGFWYDEYDEYEEDQEDLDEDEILEVPQQSDLDRFEDGFRATVFGDSSTNYATSLDYRNTIDLREIGLETEEDTFLGLKSGQSSRLNITTNMAAGRNNMVASQHHHHQQQQQQQQHQPGWSKKSSFNFRFTDKSQSAPSLPCSSSESAYNDNLGNYSPFGSSKTTVFENYTRVTSVPVDLNLCGTSSSSSSNVIKSSEKQETKMADVIAIDEEARNSGSKKINPKKKESEKFKEEENKVNEGYKVNEGTKVNEGNKVNEINKVNEGNKMNKANKVNEVNSKSEDGKKSSVRTQDPQSVEKQILSYNETPNCEEEDLPLEDKPVTSTVKTQDRIENVLEIAMAMENDVDAVVDEAIKQFKREVKEATAAGNTSEVIAAMETVQRLASSKQRPRRVKNNASYELAQQYEVNEKNLRPMPSCMEDEDEHPTNSPRRSNSGRRVLNNASYELAQQCDYIRALQSKSFQRMNACEEADESKNSITQDESLFTQIKKNSDLFSVYGEDGSFEEDIRCRLDDEVDYPCLENKPIQCLEQDVLVHVETPPTRKEAFRREIIRKKSDRTRRESQGDVDEIRIDRDQRITEGSGERLWQCEKETEEKEEGAKNCERGDSDHAFVSSPPRALESRHSSGGNPAVVVAVDRNEGRVRDNDEDDNNVDQEKRPVLSEMSTVAKRLAGASSTKSDVTVTVVTPERKKGGLGGFLQRFSKLRFSGRSKVPRSEVQKKSEQIQQVNRVTVRPEEIQKRKLEPDYIIIPLHPTEEEKREEELRRQQTDAFNRSSDFNTSSVSSNGRTPVSSKPPLPPQPPRAGALGGRISSTTSSSSRRRATTDLGNPAIIEMAKARTMQASQDRPVGLLETDLDAAEEGVVPAPSTNTSASKKTRSLLNLNHTTRPRGTGDLANENALHVPQSPVGAGHRTPSDASCVSNINQRPHKSMEFLLDKENLHFVKPPENELQKVGERTPSEHELRVQRSLQRLNVPDWFKNSPAARDGFRLKRHSDASQHGGWRALGSKTTSLSSLSSTTNRQPTTGVLLSPSPTPPVFSRWSTSLLNSAGSSPASSTRSSFNHRQPYLGWRSQERLANPRTPAERLAQGILPQLQSANKQQQQQQQQQQTTNQQLEVRNSIKEVTSAIVHYVQSGQEVIGGGRLSPRPRPDDWDDRGGARSTSPRGSTRLCWMESSFVGTKPLDSPETPLSLATETEGCAVCNATTAGSCTCADSASSGLFLDLTPTRDDLQFHQNQRPGTSPSPSSTLNYSHHHHHHQQLQPQQQQRHHRESAKSVLDVRAKEDQASYFIGELVRRKSEGSDSLPSRASSKSTTNLRQRRVSFDNSQENGGFSTLEKIVRCRNNKCTNVTSVAEARKTYKSCHNCTCLYCSRECRRAHWQRHRKTCLHSRAGALCKQVLSSAKEDPTTLKHVSALAKRGYASHGRGTVKCFFSSPEAAEKFINNGFIDLGEPTYVRWSDLLPSEMGAELYAEVMRLCKSFNPETRLVLYVAVCVVSEVPTSGAVKWERQLVSRCAKIRLDASCRQPNSASSVSPQNRQQTSPLHSTLKDVVESPETLVLTSLPGSNGQNTPRRSREISFNNIQTQLKIRGVSLRRHFPQVYKKLCSYVDGSVDKFAPVTIYPRDHVSGKSFMCIIMLDADPERFHLLPTESTRVRTVDISVEQE
ncbi:uncharacterized protein LOC122502037 isoform X2 [Leptopilina heterotoma]|uniref:uncharacterized protein LOC122502037 isoform X2 n=1 Tax=Leptopilina heterotoma TaxID=63436 RepID=UPI001CA92AF9|nr:uncharacterized protein LOC122502037 isoform X2 [Leptopilina heterotoma]